MSDDIPECRICFDIETPDDLFISPCHCKGTSKYVHKSCLYSWRNFNRDSIAWRQCMECGTEYTTRHKYPVENAKLFPIIKNASIVYFFQYILCIIFGCAIWVIETQDDYLAIRMLNFNKTLREPSLLTYIKTDELTPQIFYFSYAMFIQGLFSYLYFAIKIQYNIKRKAVYFEKIKKQYICSCFSSVQFILWYYILVFNEQPILFLNVVSFISMIEPFMYYKLIKKHNNIIKRMNEENEEEVMSFEHNPIIEHHLLLTDEVELRNIIIEN